MQAYNASIENIYETVPQREISEQAGDKFVLQN